jgi:hypothetical protein
MRRLAAASGGSRPCGCGSAGIRPTEIGAVVDITVTGGGLAQRWATVRLSGRVTAFEPERRLVLEYFDGDFRGTAEWTLSPAGPGHTHIAVRFRADPHGRGAAAGQVRGRAQHQHQRHAGGVPRHRAGTPPRIGTKPMSKATRLSASIRLPGRSARINIHRRGAPTRPVMPLRACGLS